jgi:hypothetical protein
MKKYYKNDVDLIINECKNYIVQCEDINEKKEYQDELKRVSNDFYELVNSGIFHDAIGKVVNYTNNYVDVITEY